MANTVSAVELVNAARTSNNGGGAVYNTVLWHSTAVSKADTRPAFYNCAMTDVKVTNDATHTDKNGNVRISNLNHSTEPAVWFTQSVVSLGYDYSFRNSPVSSTPRSPSRRPQPYWVKEIITITRNISRMII